MSTFTFIWSTENFWLHRWEKYQSEEEAALGRGKRQRKAVSYREAYASHPTEILNEVDQSEFVFSISGPCFFCIYPIIISSSIMHSWMWRLFFPTHDPYSDIHAVIYQDVFFCDATILLFYLSKGGNKRGKEWDQTYYLYVCVCVCPKIFMKALLVYLKNDSTLV